MKKIALTKKQYLIYSSRIDNHWAYLVIKRSKAIDAKIVSLALLNAIKQYETEVSQ